MNPSSLPPRFKITGKLTCIFCQKKAIVKKLKDRKTYTCGCGTQMI